LASRREALEKEERHRSAQVSETGTWTCKGLILFSGTRETGGHHGFDVVGFWTPSPTAAYVLEKDTRW
jgi:hypothetical protein